LEHGNEAMVEDLLAASRDWGFALADLTVPVLILHGAADAMVPAAHGEWLAAHCPGAELRLIADAGHITVLDSAPAALEWAHARVQEEAFS
jgi:pimeloyl-ACP methyl ester carboxylesterase